MSLLIRTDAGNGGALVFCGKGERDLERVLESFLMLGCVGAPLASSSFSFAGTSFDGGDGEDEREDERDEELLDELLERE